MAIAPLIPLLIPMIPALIDGIMRLVDEIQGDAETPEEYQEHLERLSLELADAKARVAATPLPGDEPEGGS